MTDSKKLRLLADWFDAEQASDRQPAWNDSTEVQDDLRRIAVKLWNYELCHGGLNE